MAAGLAAALAVLVLGGDGEDAPAPAPPEPRSWPEDPARALAVAPCPQPKGVAAGHFDTSEIARARSGRFRVFNDVELRLEPPIDWHADPLGATRFRDTFQKLRFLNPLLYAHAARDSRAALEQSLAIVLDYVRSNPRGGPTTPAEAWTDKVTGDRVPQLTYVTRAAACEDLLSGVEARELLGSVADHARYLAGPDLHRPTNHGLFVDVGLYLAADYFPFLPAAERWRRLALERFVRTLRGRLVEAVWQEHSSAYQFLVIRAVQRFAELSGDPVVDRLLQRMKRVASWFIEPDGEMTQFGDSNQEPVPPWGLRLAARFDGLQAYPRAGFAFVRDPGGDGYLAVAAGFHNTTHKHADELSFELFDHGHRIVSDTGLYHKDPGAVRDFVLGPSAHSVLVVDGRGFPIADGGEAYGSGLVATGRDQGWYAIEGANPLVRDRGVRHRRLFLYRSGEALVVVDRLRATEPHGYRRYFQLGPDLDVAERGAAALALRAPGLRGALFESRASGPAARELVRGSRDPLLGLTSPDFRIFEPRWTVALDSRAASADYAASFALDDTRTRAVGLAGHGPRTEVRLRSAGGRRLVLEVTRSGDELAIAARPGG